MKFKILFSFIFLLFFTTVSQATESSHIVNDTITDFKVKGFHLDLRIQVMTPKALHEFAEELAGFGINTLVMEYEASYPYEKHATISNHLAYSRDEVKAFIAHCKQLGIEVIPLQQCFGHMEYILRNDRYRHLREDKKEISQICPIRVQNNSNLFFELFEDMAAMHPSKYIHIGGDETYLLGHCELCSLKAEQQGKSKLFVDYMKMICNQVIELGKTPIMWADILLKYPEAAEELPKETIFIDWNYGWKTNHFGDIGALQQKGFTFWGAPSIRSHPDNWYLTEWEKHFNNQRDFIPYARKADYTGMIMTSWSTSGLYGFTWDVGNDVIDMQQIRNNYPLSGFRILIAAYAQALKQQKPLEPKKFVVEYGNKRFGFSKRQAEEFWKALTIEQELITGGKPAKSETIDQLQTVAQEAADILNQLKPVRNKKEFEHFRLMIDLRKFYLSFSEVKAFYNSADFTRGDAKQLIPDLEALLEKSQTLSQRFTTLNKGFLSDQELQEQNEIRELPLEILHKRISNLVQ